MDEKKRAMHEEVLGKDLLEGLLELSKVEKSIEAVFAPNNVKDLEKRLAAALLIIVDNRNKILKKVVELTNVKI